MVRVMIARVVYDEVRVGTSWEVSSAAEAMEHESLRDWEMVGRPMEHRTGATEHRLRSTVERGERLARLFVSERFEPLACEICDRIVAPGMADMRWSRCHMRCIQRAGKLINEWRPPGGFGRRGAYGLAAIRVPVTDSDEARAMEAKRLVERPTPTREQREEAAFLRAMAEGES